MPEESYSFAQARLRLEEIVAQVRKKDVSLEKSLDLLEEGVRLANQCTELIDHADWEAAGDPPTAEAGVDEGSEAEAVAAQASSSNDQVAPSGDDGAVADSHQPGSDDEIRVGEAH